MNHRQVLDLLLPKPVSLAVRAEQIRLLYHQAAVVQVLGVFTAIACVVMFWEVADHAMLGLWLAALVVATLIRLAANMIFLQHKITDHHVMEKWGRGYVAGAFISGVIWALLCVFFDPAWPAPYQIILFAIYTGITASSFNTNSAYFAAFPAFYLPPVAALVYIMLTHTGEGLLTLAALFVIYAMLMYVTALKLNNQLAQSLEIRFENERLAEKLAISNQRLAHLADTDELTGLFNRRSMDRCLMNEWNRHFRTKMPLSLIYLDLDYFKQYNDTYGHDGGDQCLVQLAQILRKHTQRSSDMAARFGGEEFAIILPDTSEEDAARIAAGVIADIEALQLPHANSSVAQYVTTSMGLATITPAQPDDDQRLRLDADFALYQAKNSGRNRLVIFNPGLAPSPLTTA